ncbi:MAG TPA: sulfotransferase family 2 domain-containing protein [Candidatus Sulfomarinibacteraceae bacterium]|nr:sulfotransferase family 2 domain-containing protein [Candidatus Sulfomarinibacteraceae bacterium]
MIYRVGFRSPRQRATDGSVLIFLHILKAGGTTLNNIVESNYEPRHTYATSATGYHPDGNMDDFFELSQEQREQIRLLNGHLGFGIHEHLPNRAVYITMLREPVGRVISQFNFERRLPTSPLYSHLRSGEMDVEGFVRYHAEAGEMDNLQTRMISGNWHKRGFGPCTPEMLETAKRNLREHFAVVGLTSHFDASYLLLRRYFGWPFTLYHKVNVSKNRVRREALSPDALETIRDYNRFDLELYDYAQQLFEEQVREAGPALKAELLAYRLCNYLFQRMTPYIGFLKGWMFWRWRAGAGEPTT